MTKDELKTGMIVTLRNGEEYVVFRDVCCAESDIYSKDVIIHWAFGRARKGYNRLYDYTDNLLMTDAFLTQEEMSEFDIMKVEMPLTIWSLRSQNVERDNRKLLWKREEDCDSPLELENTDFKFIWGVKAPDDISGKPAADLNTMNDAELTYDKVRDEYILSIESIYEMSEDNVVGYLQGLLKDFTEFMDKNHYNTGFVPSYSDIFSRELLDFCAFKSIREAYGTFKFVVDALSNRSK